MIQWMPRVRLAWLVAISLMSAGSLAAHSLAYRIVAPDPQTRADILARTGHGYLEAAPAVLAACGAIAIAAIAGLVVHGARRQTSPVPGWQLALVPLLGFVLQEHLERLFAGDAFAGAALEPSFLVGMALQIPFAAAALLAARLLSSAADSLGRSLTRKHPLRIRAIPPAVQSATGVLLPRLPILALGSSSRGPPPRSRP